MWQANLRFTTRYVHPGENRRAPSRGPIEQEFYELHGEAVPAIDGTGDDIFRDGAPWCPNHSSYLDPPDDPQEARQAEGEWLRTKRHHLVKFYSAMRRDISDALSLVSQRLAVAPPTKEEYDTLDLYAAKIAEVEKEIERWKQRTKPKRSLVEAIAWAKESARQDRVSDGLHRLSELPKFN